VKSCAALFLVTLATLLDEILLTRIFSVVTWYHFAFLAISIALFGMTLGAIAVYVFRDLFSEERTRLHLALSALLFAVTLAAGFLIQIRIPFSTDPTAAAFLADAAILLLSAGPFVCSGVCVCLALTRFPGRTGRMYAADLAGASAACVAALYLLKATDGPGAVIAAAAVAAGGAVLFALEAGRARLVQAAGWTAAALAGLAVTQAIAARQQAPLLRLKSVKGVVEDRPLYETWNSFSRIRVRPAPTGNPLGWGMSTVYRAARPVHQLILDIDGGASTVMTGFHGDTGEVEHLRHDVTSLVHHLRPGARVLAIGAGGGRDVLAALVFGQRSVVGVEINEAIIGAVTERFGEFTGHLERDPRVAFVNDEARSYIARQRGRYDIIQASLIDTSAATAAGAFVLTENSIYTTDAWKVFLDHLAPRGILAFSWFFFPDLPAEMYRLTSLARAALMERGIRDVRAHVVLVRQKTSGKSVGTILVSPDPFSADDLAALESVVLVERFDVVLAPGIAGDPAFVAIASGNAPETLGGDPPLRIDPPTDDAPFFFNMLRLRDAVRPGLMARGSLGGNQKAVVMLCALLAGSLALTLVCLAVPLGLAARDPALRGAVPWVLFFAGIGLGFMLVEISQMQRLMIFLGHPSYGLSVVLFALLLSGGAGSLSTGSPGDGDAGDPGARCRSGAARLACLVAALALFGGLTPRLIQEFSASPTPERILVAVALLFPIGFFMGMAFPLGMGAAGARYPGLTPWFWGVNGATSVCASVLATAMALSWGIAAAFWCGAGCYVLALGAYAHGARRLAREG